MKRIMIVDDEPLARYALKKLISTQFQGNVEVIGEADNGIDAVVETSKLMPDIIFMDIKMPGISGIEASKQILKKHPRIHIVILTAYDYFDLIQKALEIGVEGYLLKPISKEIVVKKINNIFKRIDSLDEKERVRGILSTNMNSVIELAERDFIDHIVQSGRNKELIDQCQQFLGYTMAYGYFMCLSFNDSDEVVYNGALVKMRKRQKIELAIQRYLPFMTKYVQASPRGNCVILFIYDETLTIYNQYTESLMIGEHLQHKIKLVENIEVKVGIGRPYQKIDDYNKSFKESYQAVRQIDNGVIGHIRDIKVEEKMTEYHYPGKVVEELKEKIMLSMKEESIQFLHTLLVSICLSHINISEIKTYLAQVYYDVRHIFLVKHVENIELDNSVIITLQSISLIEEIKDYMALELTRMIESGCTYFASGNKSLINTIYDYIHQHYKENITLEDLAIEIGKTSQYTSKLFKELFDVNFVEYVAMIRIEAAKRMLSKTVYKVKDVAELVGYEDANYFCRIFKKKTNMTPKDYRKL